MFNRPNFGPRYSFYMAYVEPDTLSTLRKAYSYCETIGLL